MRSCDIHHLQFESDYNESLRTYIVKRGTERLVCPVCGHEHVEADKAWMILNGDYVHRIPELIKERPGFQIGALASQLPALSWSEIANAQLEAGKTADISIQQNFDSSWRGLPYKPRKVSKSDMDGFKAKHTWTTAPSLDNVEMIFVSVDTMDDYFRVGVFAWDVNDNIYLLEVGECHDLELPDDQREKQNEEMKALGKPPVKTVEDYLNKQYLVRDGVGITPSLCVVDQGGHRGDEVKHFARFHGQVVQWKGSSMSSMNWKMSENQRQLVIGNEKHYRASIIYTLYSQNNKEQNYFYISPNIPEEYIIEILDVKPDESSKWGHLPENFISKTGKDHTWDTCKMALFLKDFALAILKRNRYRFGQAPSIVRRFDKVKKRQEKIEQNQIRQSFWQI